MIIFGIESSCDECSLALVENGKKLIHVVTHSQYKEHSQYKGVVPELASRLHTKYILPLFNKLLLESGCDKSKIDAIAVTTRPGLSGSLLVGLSFAKALSLALQVPFVSIDHIEAHFYSAHISVDSNASNISYPYIGVVISGGHTVIAIVNDFNKIEIKGTTIDDSCGEAFDKVARELGLGYLGGKEIDCLADEGSDCAASFPIYSSKDYAVSYSGLKTAVIHHRKKYWNNAYPLENKHIAAAFRKAAIDMIIDRITRLISETGLVNIVFGGGVSCNKYLRRKMRSFSEENSVRTHFPPVWLCVDNAAMIAGLGYQYLSKGIKSDLTVGVQSREYKYRKINNIG